MNYDCIISGVHLFLLKVGVEESIVNASLVSLQRMIFHGIMSIDVET
jgi:hypothetical protein